MIAYKLFHYVDGKLYGAFTHIYCEDNTEYRIGKTYDDPWESYYWCMTRWHLKKAIRDGFLCPPNRKKIRPKHTYAVCEIEVHGVFYPRIHHYALRGSPRPPKYEEYQINNYNPCNCDSNNMKIIRIIDTIEF